MKGLKVYSSEFSHVERDRIAKRVYVGEYAGSHSECMAKGAVWSEEGSR